ncbi:ABC transporter substrate-binding protein [Dictyobacter sp. S3.2.2.5]|uniref:ABC transporter substrate-binding protein n=1 Tax=Dictyobacter halimunensis TaxID=3026934 RepID=A0ABQ6FSP4_9CHLR|nr:ABC transporter substrate-binding protein [Dictyobacter sp. S3.2.2.5]
MFRTRTQHVLTLLASSFFLLLALASCGTNATGSPSSSSSASTKGNVIEVVAAEDFWGSIAAQIGGEHVHVTSIITDPNADPHAYEPTAANARTAADAHYFILNGAGYDPWAEKLLQSNPSSGRKVLNVGALNGKHEGDNPHMWYNPDDVTAVAHKLHDDFVALDAADATAFGQSEQAFLTTGLQEYHGLIADIKAKYAGTPVGASESIFSYLAPALGLKLITPDSYLKAVSEGTDISAADEATVEQQIKTRQITIFVYNSQNTPNNIQKVLNLAKTAAIPVPTITETLTPANASFQDWQSSQLKGIQSALATATGKK